LLTERAPLLAEDGIDIHDLEASDLTTLQAAMNRAVERRNMALFTPVGGARDVTATTLGLTVEASWRTTPSWPERSSTRSNPNRPATAPRPSPAASGSRWGCWTTG
jgi:hypothetical protein